MSHPGQLKISDQVGLIESSLTLEVTALAARLKAEGKPVIAFAAGEPDLPAPAAVNAAGIAAIEGDKGRYTAAAGLPALREALSGRLAADGMTYAPDEVLVTSGAKSGLFLALYALLDPGDEAIILEPYWSSYPPLVTAVGAKPVLVPCLEKDGFHPDPERIKATITPKTKLVLLNSPNNPTGAVYSKEVLAAIAEVCAQHDLAIVSDDIYSTLCYTKEPFHNVVTAAPESRARTVVINGLSKSHSMTGWRMGTMAGPKPLIQAVSRLQGQIMGCPSAISQYAAVKALEAPVDPERRTIMARRRDLMQAELAKVEGLELATPEGAFYAFPSIRAHLGKKLDGVAIETSGAMAKAFLEKELVASIPGDAFGAPEHIRFTYCSSDEDIIEGIARFRRFLGTLT